MAKRIGAVAGKYTVLLATLLPALLVAVLLAAPLISWALTTLQRDPVIPPHQVFWSVFPRTVGLSAFAAGAAVMAGASVACLYVFSSPTLRRCLTFLMTVPLLVGYLARNYSWLGLLSSLSGDQSIPPLRELGDALLYNSAGVVVVTATVFIPFAFFLTLQGFTGVKTEMFAAAQTLGCSNWKTLRSVLLPLVSRHIAIACGLCFVLALGYFVTPRMIGGGNQDFIGNEVLRVLAKPGDVGTASWIALDFLLLSAVPIGVLVWYSYRRRTSIVGD